MAACGTTKSIFATRIDASEERVTNTEQAEDLNNIGIASESGMSMIAALLMLQETPGWVPPYQPHGPLIVVTMKNRRTFTIETDPKGSPDTVSKILRLVRRGFYDGQRVHRVESWVTQWGDPVSRKGMSAPNIGDGGSGIPIQFEERPDVDFTRGIVGIASEGLQRGGDSQLFVLKTDRLYLYRSYAIVGRVIKGMDVVGQIVKGDQIRSMRVVAHRSHEPKAVYRLRRS